jgi:hypothetical protein
LYGLQQHIYTPEIAMGLCKICLYLQIINSELFEVRGGSQVSLRVDLGLGRPRRKIRRLTGGIGIGRSNRLTACSLTQKVSYQKRQKLKLNISGHSQSHTFTPIFAHMKGLMNRKNRYNPERFVVDESALTKTVGGE